MPFLINNDILSVEGLEVKEIPILVDSAPQENTNSSSWFLFKGGKGGDLGDRGKPPFWYRFRDDVLRLPATTEQDAEDDEDPEFLKAGELNYLLHSFKADRYINVFNRDLYDLTEQTKHWWTNTNWGDEQINPYVARRPSYLVDFGLFYSGGILSRKNNIDNDGDFTDTASQYYSEAGFAIKYVTGKRYNSSTDATLMASKINFNYIPEFPTDVFNIQKDSLQISNAYGVNAENIRRVTPILTPDFAFPCNFTYDHSTNLIIVNNLRYQNAVDLFDRYPEYNYTGMSIYISGSGGAEEFQNNIRLFDWSGDSFYGYCDYRTGTSVINNADAAIFMCGNSGEIADGTVLMGDNNFGFFGADMFSGGDKYIYYQLPSSGHIRIPLSGAIDWYHLNVEEKDQLSYANILTFYVVDLDYDDKDRKLDPDLLNPLTGASRLHSQLINDFGNDDSVIWLTNGGNGYSNINWFLRDDSDPLNPFYYVERNTGRFLSGYMDSNFEMYYNKYVKPTVPSRERFTRWTDGAQFANFDVTDGEPYFRGSDIMNGASYCNFPFSSFSRTGFSGGCRELSHWLQYHEYNALRLEVGRWVSPTDYHRVNPAIRESKNVLRLYSDTCGEFDFPHEPSFEMWLKEPQYYSGVRLRDPLVDINDPYTLMGTYPLNKRISFRLDETITDNTFRRQRNVYIERTKQRSDYDIGAYSGFDEKRVWNKNKLSIIYQGYNTVTNTYFWGCDDVGYKQENFLTRDWLRQVNTNVGATYNNLKLGQQQFLYINNWCRMNSYPDLSNGEFYNDYGFVRTEKTSLWTVGTLPPLSILTGTNYINKTKLATLGTGKYLQIDRRTTRSGYLWDALKFNIYDVVTYTNIGDKESNYTMENAIAVVLDNLTAKYSKRKLFLGACNPATGKYIDGNFGTVDNPSPQAFYVNGSTFPSEILPGVGNYLYRDNIKEGYYIYRGAEKIPNTGTYYKGGGKRTDIFWGRMGTVEDQAE